MTKASCIKNNKKQAPNSMTQVQTIGGLKRGRGRGRGRGAARGRAGRGGGRSDKPAAFEPFKGSANSLSAQQATGIQQHIHHGSGVFAAEQPHLAGIAKLQQQHDDAIALRAVQLAELQTQEQSQQQQQEPAVLNTSDGPGASSSAPNRPQEASSTDASSVIDLCDDEDTKQPVQQALMSSRPPPKPREQVAWSLGGNRASSSNTASSSSSNVDNPFWCPARYIPAGGENQPDLRLQTREIVQVLDSGLVPHRGKAVLDTGLPCMPRCLLLTVLCAQLELLKALAA